MERLTPESVNMDVIKQTRDFIKILNKIYMRIYNNANDNKDNLIRELQKTASDKDNFLELEKNVS